MPNYTVKEFMTLVPDEAGMVYVIGTENAEEDIPFEILSFSLYEGEKTIAEAIKTETIGYDETADGCTPEDAQIFVYPRAVFPENGDDGLREVYVPRGDDEVTQFAPMEESDEYTPPQNQAIRDFLARKG